MISGHSCIYASFIVSIVYHGVDNPTFVGMHTFLRHHFMLLSMFSTHVFIGLFEKCGWNLGGMNACGDTRLVTWDWIEYGDL